MDGVLGRVDTDHIPEPKPETVSGDSKVTDLRLGQTIRFEFGARDNWGDHAH